MKSSIVGGKVSPQKAQRGKYQRTLKYPVPYSVPDQQTTDNRLTWNYAIETPVETGPVQSVNVSAYTRVEKERSYCFVCRGCSKTCERTTFSNKVPLYGKECNGVSENCRRNIK